MSVAAAGERAIDRGASLSIGLCFLAAILEDAAWVSAACPPAMTRAPECCPSAAIAPSTLVARS